MNRFLLINFGCRASQADGAALKKQLLDAGLEECSSLEHSHVAILNTCTVTAAADREARQIIRRIRRANPDCRILVTGCYAQRAPGEIAQLPGVNWVVGNSHKHVVRDLLKGQLTSAASRQNAGFAAYGLEASSGLPSRLFEIQGPGSSPAGRLASEATFPAGPSHPQSPGDTPPPSPLILAGEISDNFHFAPAFPDDRTRPTLKIQDGCNARCSFCVIPSVRGRSRSLDAETVMGEIRRLVDDGTKEIVLSGINLGGYGKDLEPRLNFLGLLERILAETTVPRLRISSVEPMDVSPELVRLVAREPRLARHFHIPLQSGCDRILRQMSRRYWAAQYAERLLAIRELIPDCGIGADVMVGFPGETDLDHAASLRFIESLPFTYLHVFPYSLRSGTPAAQMAQQVNGRVTRERGLEVRKVSTKKRKAFMAGQVGKRLSVLTLDEQGQEGRVALSSNYLKVALPKADLPRNSLLDVCVTRVTEDLLYGYPDTLRPNAAEFVHLREW